MRKTNKTYAGLINRRPRVTLAVLFAASALLVGTGAGADVALLVAVNVIVAQFMFGLLLIAIGIFSTMQMVGDPRKIRRDETGFALLGPTAELVSRGATIYGGFYTSTLILSLLYLGKMPPEVQGIGGGALSISMFYLLGWCGIRTLELWKTCEVAARAAVLEPMDHDSKSSGGATPQGTAKAEPSGAGRL